MVVELLGIREIFDKFVHLLTFFNSHFIVQAFCLTFLKLLTDLNYADKTLSHKCCSINFSVIYCCNMLSRLFVI